MKTIAQHFKVQCAPLRVTFSIGQANFAEATTLSKVSFGNRWFHFCFLCFIYASFWFHFSFILVSFLFHFGSIHVSFRLHLFFILVPFAFQYCFIYLVWHVIHGFHDFKCASLWVSDSNHFCWIRITLKSHSPGSKRSTRS